MCTVPGSGEGASRCVSTFRRRLNWRRQSPPRTWNRPCIVHIWSLEKAAFYLTRYPKIAVFQSVPTDFPDYSDTCGMSQMIGLLLTTHGYSDNLVTVTLFPCREGVTVSGEDSTTKCHIIWSSL